MTNIGWITTTLLVYSISVLWSGYVTCHLWSWFIVPTFGANPLRLIEGIGLRLVFTFMLERIEMKEEDKTPRGTKLLRSFGVGIAWPLTALGFGWLYSRFM